ncbi:MAG: helix-turn-helix domain-containing protein [Betaproteobacteria bacterium]|nr:helix-turn-helix domain-containing protein [Betaproteobacteria bacterium]
MDTLDTPKRPAREDWHRADIVCGLWKRGTSLHRLSRKHHYATCALKNALDRPWPKAERIIAEALGVSPQEIWPSRYHEDGSPKSGRGERGLGRYKRKSSSASTPRNVKHRQAA